MSEDLIRKMVIAYTGIGYGVDEAEMKAMRAALMVLAKEFEDSRSTTYFKLDGHMVSANKIAAAAIREVAE